MSKRSLYLILLFLPFFIKAQKNDFTIGAKSRSIEPRATTGHWRIGVNPLSIVEPQGIIGPCAEYFLSNSVSLWTEAGIIVKNEKNSDRTNLTGYRFIFQPRYYWKESKTVFVTPEFRLKHYSYGYTSTFFNKNTSDTIPSLTHTAVQNIFCGAIVLGNQLSIGKNFMVEFTAGIGLRKRNIVRKPIPAGYELYKQMGGSAFQVHDEWVGAAVYFPLGIRVLWRMGKRN